MHWYTATLMLVLLSTGFSLYAGPFSTLVGRRELMRTRAPVFAGCCCRSRCSSRSALRAGAQLRADFGRLNRWSRDDRVWWSRRRRASAQLGKFNPGQKLNATFIGAAIVVMLMTGSIMKWYSPFSDSWRQGATFVHDWFAIGLLFAIIGHITLAFRDPDALNGMMHGWVKAGWAERAIVPAGTRRCVGSQSRRRQPTAAVRSIRSATLDARVADDAPEVGLGAGEVTVVDPVDGGAGDGVGEREL